MDRKQLRDLFFLDQDERRRYPLVLDEARGLALEIVEPSEAEFEAVQAANTRIVKGADGENAVDADQHGAIEQFAKLCVVMPGTDDRFFEPADDLRGGRFGGYYSTIRKAINNLIAGRDPNASDDGPSAAVMKQTLKIIADSETEDAGELAELARQALGND